MISKQKNMNRTTIRKTIFWKTVIKSIKKATGKQWHIIYKNSKKKELWSTSCQRWHMPKDNEVTLQSHRRQTSNNTKIPYQIKCVLRIKQNKNFQKCEENLSPAELKYKTCWKKFLMQKFSFGKWYFASL